MLFFYLNLDFEFDQQNLTMRAILELNETELDNKVLEAIKTAFKGLDLEISVRIKPSSLFSKEEFTSKIKQAQEATSAYQLTAQEFDDFYAQVMSNEEIDLEKEFVKFRIVMDNEGN